MKLTQRCPKCAGQKFIVTREFKEPSHDSPDHARVLPALTVWIPRTWNSELKPFGHFEAWTCARCGLTEFYASGLPDDVESVAKQYPDQVSIVDATPKDGPYR